MDDLWHPRRIEYIGRASARHPQAHAIATGSVGFALEADRPALLGHQRAGMVSHWVPDDDLAQFSGLVDDSDVADREVSLRELQQKIVFATTTVCYRRESDALVGGSTVLAFHADNHVLNVSIATSGLIVLVDAPLVFYRVRERSGAPLSTTVGFALIGKVGPRQTLSAVKAKLVGARPHSGR